MKLVCSLYPTTSNQNSASRSPFASVQNFYSVFNPLSHDDENMINSQSTIPASPSVLSPDPVSHSAQLQFRGRRRQFSSNFMGKKVKWSWSSAFVGAVAAAAVTALINAKPKDPTFHLISIKLTSFKLKLPIADAELILTIHVTNPNITPINYASTTMSIFYEGSLLGSASVKAGCQRARSCQMLQIPARLDGLELTHHAAKFFADVARREMALDAKVDIAGTAKVLWWDHKFKVHVDSHLTVDPVLLDIIEQENKSQLELFLT